MSQMDYAVLELNADADHDGNREKGVFYLVGNLEIQQGVNIDHLVGGKGSMVNSIITSRTEESAKRAGYFLDLGGGRHTFQINFTGWKGARADIDDDGQVEDFQWGDGSGAWNDALYSDNPSADATGEDPTKQMQMLMEYLRSGEFDSRADHARLHWGEYRDDTYHPDSGDAREDYITVSVLEATMNRSSEAPVSFDGSITLAEAEDWRDVVDAFEKLQI